MKTLIIPIFLFLSKPSYDIKINQAFNIIETQCNVKFQIENTTIKSFKKAIRHRVFQEDKFNYKEDLKRKNYNIFMSNQKHDNFSHHNSIWVSDLTIREFPNTIVHELMHMLTGQMHHYNKDHVLAPMKFRSNKIRKEECKLIKKDNICYKTC